MSEISPQELFRMIPGHFSLKDIESIAFDLDIDYEDFAGVTKSAKLRELVTFCARHRRMDDLVEHIRAIRPSIFEA